MKKSCLALLAFLAGCASYSGGGLQPGSATAADVEGLMGQPAARLAKADGSSVLYYPRGPAGRETFAAVLGPDGKLRSLEQVLTEANISKILPGTTTKEQVRELIGPPSAVTRMPRLPRDVWEYKIGLNADPYVLWAQFSDDGVVREVFQAKDPEVEGKSGPGLP